MRSLSMCSGRSWQSSARRSGPDWGQARAAPIGGMRKGGFSGQRKQRSRPRSTSTPPRHVPWGSDTLRLPIHLRGVELPVYFSPHSETFHNVLPNVPARWRNSQLARCCALTPRIVKKTGRLGECRGGSVGRSVPENHKLSTAYPKLCRADAILMGCESGRKALNRTERPSALSGGGSMADQK